MAQLKKQHIDTQNSRIQYFFHGRLILDNRSLVVRYFTFHREMQV